MTNNKKLVIYGAGGHAKVVLDSALLSGYAVAGFIDDDRSKKGNIINGFEILGDGIDLADNNLFIIAIGENEFRKERQNEISSKGLEVATVIDPSSVISPTVSIGRGSQILPKAVINANAHIAEGVIVNTAAVIEHDCIIEEFCHIAPGSILLGKCSVGRKSMIGAGSIVKPGIKIGNNVTVGAGSVVTKDIEDNSVVMGIPARPA